MLQKGDTVIVIAAPKDEEYMARVGTSGKVLMLPNHPDGLYGVGFPDGESYAFHREELEQVRMQEHGITLLNPTIKEGKQALANEGVELSGEGANWTITLPKDTTTFQLTDGIVYELPHPSHAEILIKYLQDGDKDIKILEVCK